MRLLAFALTLAMPSALLAADDGWIELKPGDAAPWKKVDKNWIVAKDVALDSEKKDARLKATADAAGTVWVNGPEGRASDLYTKEVFGDLEVHVEFLIAKKSNSGIKFHGVYEIQILDSFGKPDDKLSGDDCGGIYPRAEAQPKYHHIDKGIAPKTNAAKPAGEWQTLDVTFLAPRFNEKGEKSEHAKIVKATLNGTVIHENLELKTPTGNNWSKKESPTGPFMIQADHGPVAFRNVKIKPVKK
jgi:hypothetical protein